MANKKRQPKINISFKSMTPEQIKEHDAALELLLADIVRKVMKRSKSASIHTSE